MYEIFCYAQFTLYRCIQTNGHKKHPKMKPSRIKETISLKRSDGGGTGIKSGVNGGRPGYVEAMVAEGNGNDTIDSDTSPLSGVSDDCHASLLRRPVVDAQMAGVAMPMTPGLPPLTPDLIPVAPPSDFGMSLCPYVCIQRYSVNCFN